MKKNFAYFASLVIILGGFALLAPQTEAIGPFEYYYTHFDLWDSDDGLPGADGSEVYPYTADVYLKTNGLLGWPAQVWATGITEMDFNPNIFESADSSEPNVPAVWTLASDITITATAKGDNVLTLVWGWSNCSYGNSAESVEGFCEKCVFYQIQTIPLNGEYQQTFHFEDEDCYLPTWQGIYVQQESFDGNSFAETNIDVHWFYQGV